MSIIKKTTGLLLLLGAGTIIVMALQKPKVPTDPIVNKDEPQPAGGEGFIWPDGSKHAVPFDPIRDSPKSVEPSQPTQTFQPAPTVYPNQIPQPVYIPVSHLIPTVSISQPLPHQVSFNPGIIAVASNDNNGAYANNGRVSMAGFNFYN